jgi:cytochrome c-type biogenesis protein CcmH
VTGILILLVMLLTAVASLWLLKVRGGQLTAAAAVLMLGAAGYALHGSPGLPGTPRAGQAAEAPVPLAEVRSIFLGNFNATEHWLIMADSFAKRGQTAEAVNLLKAAVREHPRDYGLWVGLGNALSDHAKGMTPAARLAFARAREIAPDAPAPDYFLGLALLRSGEPAEALAIWQPLYDGSNPNAQWRPYVAQGIALAQGLQAAAQSAPPPARP